MKGQLEGFLQRYGMIADLPLAVKDCGFKPQELRQVPLRFMALQS